MSVPRPLGVCRLTPSIGRYTDVLFLEDLGECESATNYLKGLIGDRREIEVRRFEDLIIDMTGQLLDAGMVDVDHGFVNMVVPRSGRPVRLDFELARRVIWPRLFVGMYARMLGHLILLHAFAVQPQVWRTTDFARRLHARLQPGSKVLLGASNYVQKYVHEQRTNTGIVTEVTLPWD